MKPLPFFALFAIAAACQPVERILSFKHLQSPAEMNEAATVIRSLGEIRNITVRAAEKTLTVSGNAAQAELAQWLMARIDRTGNTPDPVPPQLDFHPDGGSDTVVRVLYYKGTNTTQERNEMATVIRSLIEIPSLFVSEAAGAMVVRGSLGMADAAQWVFEFLDNKTAGAVARHHLSGGGDDTIRLFEMPVKGSAEEFNHFATQLRTDLRASRFYVYTPRRIIAIRGTEALIGRAAERLGNP